MLFITDKSSTIIMIIVKVVNQCKKYKQVKIGHCFALLIDPWEDRDIGQYHLKSASPHQGVKLVLAQYVAGQYDARMSVTADLVIMR